MASEKQSSSQVPNIEHPQHVIRLLRLMREGTPSHASRASALLARYAASSSSGISIDYHTNAIAKNQDENATKHEEYTTNPSVIIWDLIGRLVAGDGKSKRNKKGDAVASSTSSGLFDLHWGTRTNCALALESVARCLPKEDRRHFFEDSDNDTGDESFMWLNVHELRRKSDNAGIDADIDSIEDEVNVKNKMRIIVERGRLLLASSGERYDWTCENDEVQEYIRENKALQALDVTANDSQVKAGASSSFLRRRILLQREILARRIGLSGILSAQVVNCNGSTTQSSIIDDFVKDEELVQSAVSATNTSSNKRKSTKQSGKKCSKGITKRRRKSRKKDLEDQDEFLPAIDIRSLLIAESSVYCTLKSQSQSRHRNPQLLLSTEVAYRTFDPQWTVRHGALLATLSLLRAWRVHDSFKSKKQVFGKWPHDILARCICIIALDRFTDFSGLDIDAADALEDVFSSAAVAPVREIAAQIIALLLEAAPTDVWECTFDLLLQLYTQKCDTRNGWEVRHGVLLVLKYVCALARLRSPPKESDIQPPSNSSNIDPLFRPFSRQSTISSLVNHQIIFDKVIKLSVDGLLDQSDDVRAVAAQVLLQVLKNEHKLYNVDIEKRCITSVWDAVCKTSDVSSSASDLLVLFAELLSHNSKPMEQIIKNDITALSYDTILAKMVSFVSFDSASVQVSCFQALSLVISSLAENAIQSKGVNAISTTSVLCDLIVRLFYEYCQNRVDASCAGIIGEYREQAWSKVLDFLAIIIKQTHSCDTCQKIINDTTVTITLRYFGVCKQSIQIAGQSHIELAFSGIGDISDGLIRAVPSHDAGAFLSKTTSSMALARFYKEVCANKVLPCISLTIKTLLLSPWLDQCEASSLLHIAIASVNNNSFIENTSCFTNNLPQLSNLLLHEPTSILVDGSPSSAPTLRDHNVQSLCDNGLFSLLNCALNSSDVANNYSIYNDMVNMWKSTFEQKGISFEVLSNNYKQSTLTKSAMRRMRLHASIAGAIVSYGSQHLPAKITPIIQSLITSIKSEDCQARAKQTCCYISRLARSLLDHPKHNKALHRLIDNLCLLAAAGCSENVTVPSSTFAQNTLELILVDLSHKELQEIPVLWDKLSSLLDSNFSSLSEQQQFNSILMLSIFSKALGKQSDRDNSTISSFVKSIIDICCNIQFACARVRNKALESHLNFCCVDFDETMNATIPHILPILVDLENNKGRAGGCNLLLSILQNFNVSVSPYVTALLPVVMRLMTDVSESCSKNASSAFAILVRIAPLSAGNIGQLQASHSSGVSEDVIRHLILGKPLPPCELPQSILQALGESGTILRPYQMEGVAWMKFLSEVSLNGALCDDMGLGKTLQSLVAVAISHCSDTDECTARKRSLVICPSTVVGHWVGEIRRFFPQSKVLSPFDFTGPAKLRRKAWDKESFDHNIVVTSYSILRSDVDILEKTIWDYCILDEGHLLKNPKTATAKASRRLKSHHRLILTGTPIQNNVHELWATFDFLMPNFLGSESSFVKEFAKPIINGQRLEASTCDMNACMNCLKILHQQVLPFVLRREKGQVMKELPPKIITDIPCVLSSQQEDLYMHVMKQSHTKSAIDLVDQSIDDTSNGRLDSSKEQKLGSNVLKSLLQLRLICTHPMLHSLFGSEKQASLPLSSTRLDSSGKLMALNDLLRHSGIVESDIMAADNDTSGLLLDNNDDFMDSDNEDDISIKEGCIEVDAGQEEPDKESVSKCLIFAQFTQSLDVVERFLFEPHMPSLEYLRLDGSVPVSQRSAIVDRFNDDMNIKVLLLTTKVGGLGLNLTGADKVIFLEPDWNPYVDLQAMDRAHRINQTKTVNVYRLITKDTIEEKMMKLQHRKRATAEAVVNADNSTMYSMGTDRLLDIFTFRGESGLEESGDGNDNVLSYLDDCNSTEYATLSVDGFLRGLK